MPCMDGFDVLRWMRENSERAVIPTIVLSSSNSPDDVKAAYQLGANAYLVKPTRFDDLQEMLTRAYQFWSWCARPECLG
jgi:CheY-like chemotaxis protein